MAVESLVAGTQLRGGEFIVSGMLSSRGGFGLTYVASQRAPAREVVIKELAYVEAVTRDTNRTTIRPTQGNADLHRSLVEKFLNEANHLARVSHPNIAAIFSAWEENGTAYFAMERVLGRPDPSRRHEYLAALHMGEVGRQPWSAVAPLAEQVLNALEAAHAVGLYHLDIKPANVLVDGNGWVKLIDFGAARRAQETLKTLTSVAYSLGYAPREQMAKSSVEPIGPYTDLYAWAMVVYGMVLGHATDDGLPLPPGDRAMLAETGRDPYTVASDALQAASVPVGWAEAIAACLLPIPSNRPADVSQVRAMTADPSTSRPKTRLERSAPVESPAPGVPKAAPRSRPSRWWLVLVGLVPALITVVVLMKVLRDSDPDEDTETIVEESDAGSSTGGEGVVTEQDAGTQTVAATPDAEPAPETAPAPAVPTTGTLAVTVAEPAGAEVWIDGVSAGAAPVSMVLSPGAHDVSVRAAGYVEITESVTVGAGEVSRVGPLRLERQAPEGFVLIEAGAFQMGSPAREPGRGGDETQHRVTLTRDFYLQSHEVTQEEWRALMGNNPSHFSRCGNDCPVETVNWYEAVAYANALSRTEGVQECYTLSGCGSTDPGDGMECTSVSFVGLDCRGYRLPTEAEWEYAARAGTTTVWHCGSDESCLAAVAWYGEEWERGPHQVMAKRANSWGLHDMSGNVWEWTGDRYGTYPSGSVTDPTGPSTGQYRVTRGGGWSNDARYVRSAHRNYNTPGIRYYLIGFRLARSAP